MRTISSVAPALATLCCLLAAPIAAQPAPPTPPVRGLKIVVAADAPELIRRAAQSLLQATKTQPLLQIMAEGQAPRAVTDSQTLADAKPEERAFSHLVLVGLPSDPMMRAAWQREARVEAGGFYVFGWGHLRGDVGYIESDRNPFLHGAAIARTPFETEVVTLTGSTPAAVALAVEAFLQRGLVNGVVAAPGWRRPQTSLLDRAPLSPGFALPAWLPANVGGARLIGVSAGGEDEYRGVLEDAGVQPRELWRAKYFRPGAWDGAGAVKAFEHYAAGLHRRAYGSTLWMARFASPDEAAQAAPKIAAAAKLQARGEVWMGAQPPYANGTYPGETPSPGPLSLWRRGAWLLMSTLPSAETAALQNAMSR